MASRTPEEVTQEWLTNLNVTREDIVAEYDEFAATYDVQLNSWAYDAPERCAEFLANVAPLDARVLDAGCGTGLSGVALRRRGFDNVDGADLSMESLRVARQKGVYRALVNGDLLASLPLLAGDYDVVFSAGVLSHIPDEAVLWEFCRLVRPGGFVAFSQREDLSEAYGFPAQLQALATAGVWASRAQSDPEPYLWGNEEYRRVGVLARYYVFEVLRETSGGPDRR